MARSRNDTVPGYKLPRRLPARRPKSEQIHKILVDLIEGLEPGVLLPSERVLAEQFHVARMTVRTEIDRLVRAGMVTRRHGQGTFVAEPKLIQSDLLVSFSQDMLARGLTPGSHLLSIDVEPIQNTESKWLALPLRTAVVRIVRVRTADETPIAVERASLPSERFAGLEDADLDGGTSLYQLLEGRFGVRPHAGEQRVSAVLPDPDDASLLHVPETQPCFRIERVTRDANGEVVEFGHSLYRGDRYDIVMHVVRDEAKRPQRNGSAT